MKTPKTYIQTTKANLLMQKNGLNENKFAQRGEFYEQYTKDHEAFKCKKMWLHWN